MNTYLEDLLVISERQLTYFINTAIFIFQLFPTRYLLCKRNIVPRFIRINILIYYIPIIHISYYGIFFLVHPTSMLSYKMHFS